MTLNRVSIFFLRKSIVLQACFEKALSLLSKKKLAYQSILIGLAKKIVARGSFGIDSLLARSLN
jgi:hypothetical protein